MRQDVKKENNNTSNGDPHEIVLNRSLFTFIKGEVENILIREYHCSQDDWSRIHWFMNFEQILELIRRGMRHVILFLQIPSAFDRDFKTRQ